MKAARLGLIKLIKDKKLNVSFLGMAKEPFTLDGLQR